MTVPATFIPSGDLARQYRSIKPEIDAAIECVLTSGEFERAEELWAFEDEFAAFCEARYAVGVGSGYAALFIALRALGVGPGDEVITVPNTDIATCSAISHCGARIVWADVEEDTFNIDPERVAERITPRTKAIVAVHLYGLPADLDRLAAVAGARGIPLVEDAALACGARLRGRRAGSIGTIACFSFAPHKILGAYGDGGMVVTQDRDLAERARLLAGYGEGGRDGMTGADGTFHLYAEGYHTHLDVLQAAVLRVKLRYVEGWIAARRQHARLYDRLFEVSPEVRTPVVPAGFEHVYRAYTMLVPERDRVRARLVAEGIAAGLHYVPPLHLQPVYRHLGLGRGSFPVAERLGDRLICLPIYPELAEPAVETVANAVLQAVEGYRHERMEVEA